MTGVNKVILIGNVGADPDIAVFNGVKKAIFSLATTIFHNNKKEYEIDDTQWHNIVCWKNLADLAEQSIKKGTLLYVEGYLKYCTWNGKQGQNFKSVEIIATQVQILQRKANEKSQEEPISKVFFAQQPAEISNMSVFVKQNEELDSLGDLPL